LIISELQRKLATWTAGDKTRRVNRLLCLNKKYRCTIKSLLIKWIKRPTANQAKTWVLFGKSNNGNLSGVSLFRLVSSPKLPFRWRLPESNPYLRDEIRKTVTSRYNDVAMAVSHD